MSYRDKEYSYSIALLKIIMSFVVVMCHFDYSRISAGGIGDSLWLLLRHCKPLAVPTFALLAVYFMAGSISDKKKISSRLKRLAIPHIAWSVIYIISMFFILQHKGEFNIGLYIKESIYQIIFGSTYNGPAWFQVDLIFITIFLYWLYSKFANETAKRSIVFACIFSLIIQYTGLNRAIIGVLPYEMEGTLGRLVELIPYVGIGIYLKAHEKRIIGNKKAALILAFLSIVALYMQKMIPAGSGYNYNGVGYIFSVTCIVFCCVSLTKVRFNSVIEKLIRYVASYTMGVYFIQYLVGYIMAIIFIDFHYWNDIYRCVIVYIVSFVISVLISCVPNKSVKKLVM